MFETKSVALATATCALSTTIVVDSTKLGQLTVKDQNDLMALVQGTEKKVLVVGNFVSFFNRQALLKALEAGEGDHIELIAEKLGVKLDETQVSIIMRAAELRAEIALTIKPKYDMMNAPDDLAVGWSVGNGVNHTINVGKQSICRHGYKMGVQSVKTLWTKASAYWAGHKNASNSGSVLYDGYHKNFETQMDRVRIGCQSVPRYEFEQLALFMGWDFPEKA